MHFIIKKATAVMLILAMLALAVGCAAKTGGQKVDFSGVWEGSLTVEGMRMPGKMILELDSNGKGSARFGFVDELTQESIPVELNKENGLKGEGSADQMHFNFEGKFYEMEEEWVFAGNLIINDGYEINDTTVEFFREGSESIPDLRGEIGYPEEMSPEAWGNSIDFSGEWTGVHLLAEVSGAGAQENKHMEGLTTDCRLVLSLPDYGTGTAQLQFDDDLAGPELTAAAAHDRLTLDGLLWGSPFEWSGTFEYDEAAGEWTLTGGGDVTDTTVDVIFHIVLSLNQASADAPGQPPQASEPNNQSADINAPLDEFLIGSWMGPPSNVMTEREILAIYYDGTIEKYYATPGAGDTEETWLGGSWKLDEPAPGTWRVEGNKLIAKFENDSISFETDVRVIDAGSIEIEVFYTRSEYYRLPAS
ncbi:MAG: hypothetical protein GX617_17300 [Lentisphaerae bacterium]|nr:hypothetical protein [Lentisphaerota bacterium]